MTVARVARALTPRPMRTSRGWLVPCVAHDDRDPSLHLSEGAGGRLLVRCFAGCDQQQVIAALEQRGLWGRRADTSMRYPAPQPTPTRQAKTTTPWAARVWSEARSSAGTLTDQYLAARGIRCAIPPSIRHHPALPYRHDDKVLGRFPALVAAVADLITGRLMGVQRIYLPGAIDADPVGKLVLYGDSAT